MKSRLIIALTTAAAFALLTSSAVADGLIQQLPTDGSWVRFDLTGEGRSPAGDVGVTLKGTLTLRSVGRETVDGAECRWIETETSIEIQRGGANYQVAEALKLLIPEKYLVADQNPRAHVFKAWKKDREGTRELDLKGNDAREVESVDELFHAPLPGAKRDEGIEFKAPGGTFRCARLNAKSTSKRGDSEVEFTTETWVTDKIPFGVAGFRQSKSRGANGVSQGARTMELKFAESGTGAKSAIEK